MIRKPFRHLLLGISGSSAATAADRLLKDAAAHADRITVVATPNASRFLPLLPPPLYTDRHWAASSDPLHVTLLDGVDAFVVAPATATTLARAAAGLADTLLCALILTHGPGVVFQPAMNSRMWNSPATRRAVDTLTADGHHVLPPAPTASLTSDQPNAVGVIPGTVLANAAACLRRHRAHS
jgi:phosphopantothenoylcysteine synthetase/decarboxylase